jgi:hypothetical protein
MTNFSDDATLGRTLPLDILLGFTLLNKYCANMVKEKGIYITGGS